MNLRELLRPSLYAGAHSVVFGTISEVLARHDKGDTAAVSGRLTKSVWTGRDGAERAGLSVCVDAIASARTVRPGKLKVRSLDEDAVPFNGV